MTTTTLSIEFKNTKRLFFCIWSMAMLAVGLSIYRVETPTRRIEDALATLVKYQHEVLLRPDGDAIWNPVGAQQGFIQGDQIATGEGARALIQFKNGEQLELGPHSRIVLNLAESEKSDRSVAVMLKYGSVAVKATAAVQKTTKSAQKTPVSDLQLIAGKQSYQLNSKIQALQITKADPITAPRIKINPIITQQSGSLLAESKPTEKPTSPSAAGVTATNAPSEQVPSAPIITIPAPALADLSNSVFTEPTVLKKYVADFNAPKQIPLAESEPVAEKPELVVADPIEVFTLSENQVPSIKIPDQQTFWYDGKLSTDTRLPLKLTLPVSFEAFPAIPSQLSDKVKTFIQAEAHCGGLVLPQKLIYARNNPKLQNEGIAADLSQLLVKCDFSKSDLSISLKSGVDYPGPSQMLQVFSPSIPVLKLRALEHIRQNHFVVSLSEIKPASKDRKWLIEKTYTETLPITLTILDRNNIPELQALIRGATYFDIHEEVATATKKEVAPWLVRDQQIIAKLDEKRPLTSIQYQNLLNLFKADLIYKGFADALVSPVEFNTFIKEAKASHLKAHTYYFLQQDNFYSLTSQFLLKNRRLLDFILEDKKNVFKSPVQIIFKANE